MIRKLLLIFAISLLWANTVYAEFSIQPEEQGVSWFLYTTNAGSAESSRARAINLEDEDGIFAIYPVDAIEEEQTGGFLPAARTHKNTKVGTWINISNQDIKISAKKSIIIPFTISVPQKTPSGKYAGALMIEKVADQKKNGSMINIASRVGARIYITVPSNNNPKENIIVTSVEQKNIIVSPIEINKNQLKTADIIPIISKEKSNTIITTSERAIVPIYTKNKVEKLSWKVIFAIALIFFVLIYFIFIGLKK